MKISGMVACGLVLVGMTAAAQSAKPVVVDGTWLVVVDYLGTMTYWDLKLELKGDRLTGNFTEDKINEGSVAGNHVHFVARDEMGGSEVFDGEVVKGEMAGTIVWTNGNSKDHPATRTFKAMQAGARPAAAPQRREFVPTVFYREFSALHAPVLRVNPGDTIHTTTVDAAGHDERGVERSLGGNPQTGPFYVETAMPGDTLAVHIVRLKLNRDYAVSDDSIVSRGMNGGLAIKMKDVGKQVKWHLDREGGMARTESPGEHLKGYTVALRPMLGCIAAAPGPGRAAPNTGDSGSYGGNMDFNEIVEGATVYLPVSNPGALLYFGDAHAAQGDGEMNGNALETSMDVEVTVDVIPHKRAPGVRVENATHLMAMGLEGSLDEAFKSATANMAAWLAEDYKLSPSEVAQVIGTAAEYRVSEVADRNAGVVLKISKERLRGVAP